MPDNLKALYENGQKWGTPHPETVLERARLTVQFIPEDVKSVLDVGSGNGLITKTMQHAGYDPIAFDISHHALKHIQSVRRVQGTADQIPFPANSFDLVMACELLEHIPDNAFSDVLNELANISNKYIIITVPYCENLEWSFAQCPACGCIFNGAYHVRSFDKNMLLFLLKDFKCIHVKGIVSVLHPDRTPNVELFIRHNLANEYLYCAPGLRCPLCFSIINKKPQRNIIGLIASGIRYLYRLFHRKEFPLWYLAVYEKKDELA